MQFIGKEKIVNAINAFADKNDKIMNTENDDVISVIVTHMNDLATKLFQEANLDSEKYNFTVEGKPNFTCWVRVYIINDGINGPVPWCTSRYGIIVHIVIPTLDDDKKQFNLAFPVTGEVLFKE